MLNNTFLIRMHHNIRHGVLVTTRVVNLLQLLYHIRSFINEFTQKRQVQIGQYTPSSGGQYPYLIPIVDMSALWFWCDGVGPTVAVTAVAAANRCKCLPIHDQNMTNDTTQKLRR